MVVTGIILGLVMVVIGINPYRLSPSRYGTITTLAMAKLSLERIRMRGIEALSRCDDPQRWRRGEQRALGEVRRGLFGRHFRQGDRLDGRSIRWNCDNSHYEGVFFWVVRTGYGPTTTRCRRTIDLSVSVVALLSE